MCVPSVECLSLVLVLFLLSLLSPAWCSNMRFLMSINWKSGTFNIVRPGMTAKRLGVSCVVFTVITHNVFFCFLCAPAVSSGCSQPTGSVWRQPWKTVTSLLAEWDTENTESPQLFFSVVSLFALCLWTGVNLCYSLFLPPFIFLTPPPIYSVICHSDIQPVPSPHETVADCWFTHQFRVAFSACLHRFPQKTNPALLARWQIDAEGKVEVTKGCFIITSLRCLWREAGPSCMEL